MLPSPLIVRAHSRPASLAPRAALRPLSLGSPRSLPTRLGSLHSHVGDEKQPQLTSSKTSLCTPALHRDPRNPFRICFYENSRGSPPPLPLFPLFPQTWFPTPFPLIHYP